MENEEAVENYYKILSDFNIKNNISYDSLNAIFYCLEYKINGTIIEKMENKVFEKLINFDIPIIFIITKTPYDLSKKPKSKKIEEHRENERNIIKNAIKDLIQTSFNDKNKAKVFIDNYVKFFFVNLVRIESEDPPVPVFGTDKILSYFLEKVPKKDWDALELACYTRDEKKCKELLKKNIFLRYYSEFENLNLRNQEKAKKYLKNLKLSAFFSGMIPGVDIGMEYYYKYLFKKKLKALYGFDYDQAEEALKGKKPKKNSINEDEHCLIEKDEDEKKILEKKIIK